MRGVSLAVRTFNYLPVYVHACCDKIMHVLLLGFHVYTSHTATVHVYMCVLYHPNMLLGEQPGN